MPQAAADGHPTEALQHARRALGSRSKNPFYLSYTGLLAAVAEKRYGDGEALCQEALGCGTTTPSYT